MTYRKYRVTITGTVEVEGMNAKNVKDSSSLCCMGCPVEHQKKDVKLIQEKPKDRRHTA